MSLKLAIIINKNSRKILPSETFLLSHINNLPCDVLPLVGNPGFRCLDDTRNIYVPSRKYFPLGWRWTQRKIGLSSVAKQDRLAVIDFLKKYKVDAVLAEYGPSAVSVLDSCKDATVPLIAHFHGWDAYSEYELNRNTENYKRLFEYAAAVIAVSKHMRDQLIALGADPEKTYHNACGAEIPSELKANPAKAGKRFLMVGRLIEKKAPFISILAFSKVAALYKDASLDIVGDGPLRDACILLCENLRLGNQVTFHGALSHDLVLDLMANARCFIQHSVCAPNGDREGTPVGVLEAMGVGLPVVATRHTGILDVINCGKTGSLVDEYDLDGMAQGMMVYARDAALAKQIGENARIDVMNNWTNARSIERLWTIIEGAIKKSCD